MLVDCEAGDAIPATLEGVDGVISLGGPMSLFAPADLDWLGPELDLIRRAIADDVPFYGVCLAAQLLALAFGGRVHPGGVPEVGPAPVRLLAAAAGDPVFGGLGETIPAFHWHADTFELPATATLLASSEQYPHQVIRIGATAYGVQFHAESSLATVRGMTEIATTAAQLEQALGPGAAGRVLAAAERDLPVSARRRPPADGRVARPVRGPRRRAAGRRRGLTAPRAPHLRHEVVIPNSPARGSVPIHHAMARALPPWPGSPGPAGLPGPGRTGLLAFLPRGSTLPDEVWERRHRIMLLVVALQLAALGTAGVVVGVAPLHLAYLLGPILLCGLAASERTASRRWRGSMLSFAALYCSAALVDLTHGTTEAHFHFFVMVAMLSIYEEWVPYLLAAGFVVIHHGLVGMIAPGTVYDHGSAALTPWTWALIHAGFIVALCVVNVASWRLNEEARDGMADALEHTRRSEEEFRGAFDDAPIGVAFVDLAGHFRRVNRSLCSLTGFAEADFATLPLHDAPDGTPGLFVDRHPGDAVAFEGPFRRADGTTGWGLARRSTIHDAAGIPSHAILQLLDLSARKRAEQELAHAATHDPLTGLPNRKHFERAATEALERLGDGESVALLFIDIDDFKLINDSLGHGAGDRLLLVDRRAAAGTRSRAGRAGPVRRRRVHHPARQRRRARGDRDGRRGARGAARAGRSRRRASGSSRPASASRSSDRSPSSAGALIRDADAAMYQAKATGKDRLRAVRRRAARAAVRRGWSSRAGSGRRSATASSSCTTSPSLDLATGRTVIGVEALLRWRRPATAAWSSRASSSRSPRRPA